jgi:acetoacetate decarboxylase
MSLVNSPKEVTQLKKQFTKGFLLGDTNMVMVIFKTDPAVVERILPPPLEPAPDGLASAYVAEFQKTNFGIKYNEAALSVQALYDNERGNYCLSMPVDNDIAMVAGREVYGFPKKIADSITLTRQDNTVTGSCIRHEVPIIEIEADIQTPFPEKFTPNPYFVLKAFPSLDVIGVDDHPKLIRLLNTIEYGPIEIGTGQLRLNKSLKDPLHEIPVFEVTMAAYVTQTNIWMQPGEVLTELKPDYYLPYLLTRFDGGV